MYTIDRCTCESACQYIRGWQCFNIAKAKHSQFTSSTWFHKEELSHIMLVTKRCLMALVLVLSILTQLTVAETDDVKVNATVAVPQKVGAATPNCTSELAEECTMKKVKDELLLESRKKIRREKVDGAKKESKGDKDVDITVMSLSRLGRRRKLAASSCNEIRDANPSAHSRNYWLMGSDEASPATVYCDYEFEPPPSLKALVFSDTQLTAGWMRALDMDMSRHHASCPNGLWQVDRPCKACGYNDENETGGCNSVTFSTHGVPYKRICGMASGYGHHIHLPDSSTTLTDCPSCGKDIDTAYLNGISITYGTPRNHVWSYAAVWTRDNPSRPEFINEDYHCCGAGGSGRLREDVQGTPCDEVESSCCRHPGLPWFCKELSEPTTADIEVRLCRNQEHNSVFVDKIKIYLQ